MMTWLCCLQARCETGHHGAEGVEKKEELQSWWPGRVHSRETPKSTPLVTYCPPTVEYLAFNI